MAAAPPSQQSILLIEDEENDVLLLRIAFEKAGLKWPIFRVASGLQGQAYLNGDPPYQDRTRYPFPALVLLDVKMPVMDGFAVLRWIRRQPAFASLPVVVLTGSSDIHDADTAYQLGANSFLVKPINFRNEPDISASLERLMQPS